MDAILLLCDAAQVADGKLSILGGGWTHTGPQPAPSAVAVKFDLAPEEVRSPHHWVLELQDLDGRPVMLQAADGGMHAVEMSGDFEFNASGGALPGSEGVPVVFPLAMSLTPLPLPPGRYTWRLFVDGNTDDRWEARFVVRSAPVSSNGA